jgi:hypothetical protein
MTHADLRPDEDHVTEARREGILARGAIAGVIGASAVALWFLLIDTIAGRPLHTPSLLGAMVLRLFNADIAGPVTVNVAHVAFYTLLHYAVFIALGILVFAIVRLSRRNPSVLALALMLFVAVEVAFTGFVAALQFTGLGTLAWTHIAVGNLIAAVSMGWYVWKSSPQLRGSVSRGIGSAPAARS